MDESVEEVPDVEGAAFWRRVGGEEAERGDVGESEQ